MKFAEAMNSVVKYCQNAQGFKARERGAFCFHQEGTHARGQSVSRVILIPVLPEAAPPLPLALAAAQVAAAGAPVAASASAGAASAADGSSIVSDFEPDGVDIHRRRCLPREITLRLANNEQGKWKEGVEGPI